jgi:DnaJ-class molecular chaperone
MTATLLDSPGCVGTESSRAVRAGDGRITLEERLRGAWRGLHVDNAAECPVCGGRMTLSGEAGECRGCGARLL